MSQDGDKQQSISPQQFGSDGGRDPDYNIPMLEQKQTVLFWIQGNPIKSLLIFGIILKIIFFILFDPSAFTNVDFNFQVYCPASYELEKSNRLSKEEIEFYDNVYIVRVRENDEISNNQTIVLSFCGLAREWADQDCSNAKFICTNPGPIFELQANQPVTIFWLNEIQDTKKMSKHHLYDDSKLISKNIPHFCPSKTFYDPLQLQSGSDVKKKVLDEAEFIISPHIQGMEAEPSQAGNPLSWFTNKGSVGLAYQSFDLPYYDSPEFHKKGNEREKRNYQRIFEYLENKNKTLLNYRVNRYSNSQSPGVLWYYDRSMGLEGSQILKGLFGFYLIRNKTVEEKLGSRDSERLVVIYRNTPGLTASKSCENNYVDYCTITSKITNNIVEQNGVYRFRIMNADYSQVHSTVRFYVSYLKQPIKFRIVGSNSNLNGESSELMESVDLHPGERVDIIVKFNLLPPFNIFRRSYFFTVKSEETKLFQGYIMKGNGKNQSEVEEVSDIGTTFSDYRELDENVSKVRMRPLVYSGWSMGINGHTELHSGMSQNPRVGSVEDWYFINTMEIVLPVHINLIRFQNLAKYDLRRIPGSACNFYHVDFYMYATQEAQDCSFSKKYNATRFLLGEATLEEYQEACRNIPVREEHQQCFEGFANEQEFDPKTNTSGLNLLSLLPKSKSAFSIDQGNCDDKLASYKYLCQNLTSLIPGFKRGYTDLTHIGGNEAVGVRIRWASASMSRKEFDQAQRNPEKQFFSVKEAALLEYPGFIYECGVLGDKSSQSFRPIMMQSHPLRKDVRWKQIFPTKNTENCKGLQSN